MERQKRRDGTATVTICFRVSPEEAARIRAAGAWAGPTQTDWMRELVMEGTEKTEELMRQVGIPV